jgi:tyrosinase
MPAIPGEAGNLTTRSPGPANELPNLTTPTPAPGGEALPSVESVLGLTSFVDVSGQLQNIHDAVHGWVGGQMGVISTAAFDPIFWTHHTMIDRLWYQWQLKHGINNIPPNYLGQTLEPFGLTVEQVLDVNMLGYDYASSSAIATPAAPGGK